MKKLRIKIFISLFFSIIPFLNFAQQTGPGNPGGEPIGSDPPLGGGAPIGGGLSILISLGAIYGGKKLYSIKNELED